MILSRSPTASSRPASLRTVKTLLIVAFAGYPAAVLASILVEDPFWSMVLRYGLGLLTLFAAVRVLRSPVNRIVRANAAGLDEFELDQRRIALSRAYRMAVASLLFLIFYAGLSSDFDLWMPDSGEEYFVLWWGVLLYASLLPTALLVGTMPAPLEDEDLVSG